MSGRGNKRLRMRKGAIIGLAVAALAAAAPVTSASAQGLFEFLFGGFRRPPPPPAQTAPPSDPFSSLFEGSRRRDPESVSGGGGGGVYSGFCVRLCDGRYFPVQAQRNASTAAQCSSACPASQTKVFSGSDIAHAVAPDGRRYADLPNAFVYRQRMVPGCTCNGSSSVGLANMAAADDPTLRPGDIVVSDSGLTVYNGRDRNQQAAFAPITAARVPSSLRDVRVTPRSPPPAATSGTALQDRPSSTAGGQPRVSVRER